MPLDDKILERLRDNDPTLTSLNLWNNRIGAEGAKALAGVLVRNTTLTSLNLGDNRIGAEGAKALAGMLKRNTSLTSLYLEDNSIGDEGAKALAEMLTRNTTLTSLSLGWNSIGVEGAKALAGMLERNTSLTELNFGNNLIGDEGANALAGMLERNTFLTKLSLYHNRIGKELKKQIDGLIERNQQYLKNSQAEAFKQLKLARILLYKTTSADIEPNLYLNLPLELQEKIVSHVSSNTLLIKEQQRLIINYAKGNIAPVADKLSFFKVTQCDRVRKQLNQAKIETASRSHVPLI